MIYTPMTKKAIIYMFEKHKDQKDKSNIPYVYHPLHVAENLPDEITTTVALLHDVVEDTNYNYDEVEKEFGKHVADLVDGVHWVVDRLFGVIAGIVRCVAVAGDDLVGDGTPDSYDVDVAVIVTENERLTGCCNCLAAIGAPTQEGLSQSSGRKRRQNHGVAVDDIGQRAFGKLYCC